MESIRPPYDPEVAAALAAESRVNPSRVTGSITVEDLGELREYVEQQFAPAVLDAIRADPDIVTEEAIVPGPAGQPDIIVTVIRRKELLPNAPGFYHIHGGGMFTGNRYVGLLAVLEYAKRYGVVSVSPEYRLAPEHPHPAPVEDCYAGLVWMADHADDLGIDPRRVMVGGGSAGGGLAAAVALLARDRGGPPLVGQMLMSPMLDDRDQTVSTMQFDGTAGLNRQRNDFGWRTLLGDAKGGPEVSMYAAPSRAEDLSGLPSAFIDVGSAEVLRDEAVSYATRLWAAGVQAELHVWAGGAHGFNFFTPHAEVSQACQADRLSWLRRTLSL